MKIQYKDAGLNFAKFRWNIVENLCWFSQALFQAKARPLTVSDCWYFTEMMGMLETHLPYKITDDGQSVYDEHGQTIIDPEEANGTIFFGDELEEFNKLLDLISLVPSNRLPGEMEAYVSSPELRAFLEAAEALLYKMVGNGIPPVTW